MSSGFITETEIEAAKKKRQEDWERVRKADDPLEAPEPTYDSRSLYERLQEQKQKRDLEYEEAHKLSEKHD
ncbi:protein FAM192A isoform X2 [Agrilus planipennis]|uniref:Protein FAM192A isoform X2 n=1 Tax=Agrilus planipennis TaxID=224129 RepID=A0A1W4WPG9_AGRPL|nr:protein FAM192A isoform X2 [Agrilus planipennis]